MKKLKNFWLKIKIHFFGRIQYFALVRKNNHGH